MELNNTNISNTVKLIGDLFTKYGKDEYIGEPLSILDHSLQCAQQAIHEKSSSVVVVGAFLHDIGHLLGKMNGLLEMQSEDGSCLGAADHDNVGGQWLEDHAFPKQVVFIVKNHVNAKRYLCATDELYCDKLSDSSKQTLELQGGFMSQEEVNTFRTQSDYKIALKIRAWDEKAKIPNHEIDLTLPKMLDIIKSMLCNCDK